MKKLVFPNIIDNQFGVGQKITVNDTFSMNYGDKLAMLYRHDEWYVKSVESVQIHAFDRIFEAYRYQITQKNWALCICQIKNIKGDKGLDAFKNVRKQYFERIKVAAKRESYTQERCNKEFGAFERKCNTMHADFGDAYCITAYSVQGSTYPHVFVNYKDIQDRYCDAVNNNWDGKTTFFKEVYVAASRGKTTVHILI